METRRPAGDRALGAGWADPGPGPWA